ncbi:uncharacterized protein LOC130736973 [Lotus japonicus]|uniref:uncharacterized protein LOC130736973 n=1 Tax=Lotus japonicus TaxID=34305 RepID=UPI00258651BB|nr:uncharacterized protein LOC130736973 [Lotus japonicus]
MTTQKSIGSFFKKKEGNSSNQPQTIATPSIPPQDERPSKCRRIQPEEMNVVDIERDPGLRPMMWEFPFNQRDEIRRAYLKVGPYQPRNIEFPFSGEARDESKREQMAIILRFVDKDGFVRERFFHVVHVKDTMSSTLKNEVCAVLSHYDLHVENIRGQGYDCASNMRGEWNGLQSLFLKECPYAYYVHCMAHRLQLALVTASREVKQVHQFFESLTSIINVVGSSSKRHDELQDAQALHIQNQISNNEIETKKRRKSNWYIAKSWRYSMEFSLSQIMEITNLLCKALQQQSQDIVNAMHLVSTTKSLLQKLREDGPKEAFKSFKVDDICKLVEKYYPKDFTDQENIHLRIQLQHYELDVLKHFDFQEISTLCELCRVLSSFGKSTIYHLVDRVIRLVLTLPISTATTERAFSTMKLVKTRLHNKMEDDFLADTMTIYIEKDITKTFTIEEIMEEFYQIKNRRRI